MHTMTTTKIIDGSCVVEGRALLSGFDRWVDLVLVDPDTQQTIQHGQLHIFGERGDPAAFVPQQQQQQQQQQYQQQQQQQQGRKKALLVGINYVGSAQKLSGCINDVLAFKDVLIQKYGFSEQEMQVMVDDPPSQRLPTAQNIWEGLKWLLQGSGPSDVTHSMSMCVSLSLCFVIHWTHWLF